MAKKGVIDATRTTTVSIANTETQVVGITVPANFLKVGAVIEVTALGLETNTTSASSPVLRIRVGSASLNGAIPASWTAALGTTARTNVPFFIKCQVTVISIGASGTALGQIYFQVNSATALNVNPTVVTAAVTIDTTASRVVELTAISGAATTTLVFHSASLEIKNTDS